MRTHIFPPPLPSSALLSAPTYPPPPLSLSSSPLYSLCSTNLLHPPPLPLPVLSLALGGTDERGDYGEKGRRSVGRTRLLPRGGGGGPSVQATVTTFFESLSIPKRIFFARNPVEGK